MSLTAGMRILIDWEEDVDLHVLLKRSVKQALISDYSAGIG
jgi:hypothetical protein